MEGDSRYKLFRNFMVNELGITRADIEKWTKEAVSQQVEKIAGQLNVEQMATAAVQKALIGPYGKMGHEFEQIVKTQVIKAIGDKIKVSTS